MTRTRKLAVLTAAVAVAAGVLTAQGFLRQRFESRFEKVATFLNLSADQKSQAKTIIDAAFKEAEPAIAELKQNHQAMQQLIKLGNSAQFDQEAQKLASNQGALVSRLILIHARTMTQVRALLTPEQLQKAEQLHELMRPQFGRMGGPHMPKL